MVNFKHYIASAMAIKYLFVIALAASMASQAYAANIIARTDRAQIQLNQTFTLTYEAAGKLSGDPDFAPLDDSFEIVNSTESSTISLVNGRADRKQVWTLRLFPKRDGTLTVPAIQFGKDQSPEIQIVVGKATAGNTRNNSGKTSSSTADIFLKAAATPEKPYVQSQVLYTVRLFLGVNVSSGDLSMPELSDPNAIIERFGEDKTYDTNISNRRYRVIERRYTIFPQKAGTLTIKPVRFNAKLQSRRRGLFDPFGTNGEPVRMLSNSVELSVQPIPATFSNKAQWLPVETLRIAEDWSPNPPVFIVGEPVTRNLKLEAKGVSATLLPVLNIGLNAGFKQYPDQPVLEDKMQGNSILATRLEKIALIPTQPGQFTLPAIDIPWWNTKTGQQEVTRLPAREVTVKAAANNSATLPSPAPAPALQTTDSTMEASPAASGTNNIWLWVSLALAVIWLATILAWWLQAKQRNTRAKTTKPSLVKAKPDIKNMEKQIKNACRNNDKMATKTALLTWATAHWPHNPPLSIGAIASHVNGELHEQINLLNDVLYRNPEKNWQGEMLWAAFQTFSKNNTHSKPDSGKRLKPLHKI